MTLAESFRLLPHTNSYKRDLELKPQRYFPLNSLYITISWWTMGSSIVIPKLSVLIVYQGSNDNRSIFSGQNLSDKAIFGKPKNVQKQIATQKKVHRMTLCIVDIHPHIKFVQTLEHWSSCIKKRESQFLKKRSDSKLTWNTLPWYPSFWSLFSTSLKGDSYSARLQNPIQCTEGVWRWYGGD